MNRLKQIQRKQRTRSKMYCMRPPTVVAKIIDKDLVNKGFGAASIYFCECIVRNAENNKRHAKLCALYRVLRAEKEGRL